MGSMPPAGSLVTSLFWVQFSYLSYEWALKAQRVSNSSHAYREPNANLKGNTGDK